MLGLGAREAGVSECERYGECDGHEWSNGGAKYGGTKLIQSKEQKKAVQVLLIREPKSRVYSLRILESTNHMVTSSIPRIA